MRREMAGVFEKLINDRITANDEPRFGVLSIRPIVRPLFGKSDVLGHVNEIGRDNFRFGVWNL